MMMMEMMTLKMVVVKKLMDIINKMKKKQNNAFTYNILSIKHEKNTNINNKK